MVEIHIDTKKDSREEIRKVIAYLKSIVGEKSDYEDFSYGSSEDSGEDYDTEESVFNIFGDSSEEKEKFEEDEDEEPARLIKY